MFTEIIEQIEAKKYGEAVAALLPLYSNDDVKISSHAGYLLGYINSRYDYESKDLNKARKYLRGNIYGQFPHPFAYVLYSRIEEDENVAINHLNMGLEKYPDDAEILLALLSKSPDKNAVIGYINERKVDDPLLIGRAIFYLYEEKKWEQIRGFIDRIENTGNVDEVDQLYLDLIKAYTYIFHEEPDISMAKTILEKLVTKDTDNELAYSHFLGLIYTLIREGEEKKAISYFDRLPVNGSIMDFDEQPFPLGLEINFLAEYNTIFNALFSFFSQDSQRRLKAQVLHSLYLYHPSESYDVCRYKKSDAAVLTRYLKAEFNPKVAAALYNMRCHFGQYKEAYNVLWLFPQKEICPEEFWLNFSDSIEDADSALLKMLAEETVKHLNDCCYDEEIFGAEFFIPLVKKLYEFHLYTEICSISEYLSDEMIIRCGCAFECAYSYSQANNSKALALYEKLVEKEPSNASAINNLGVQYRENGELYKALYCYEKASRLCPKEKIYKENLKKIKISIQEQISEDIEDVACGISTESLQELGYNVELCKRLFSIQDAKLRDIILRDLRECAIAVVAGQDKLATIMCGSIVEALLLYRISDKGIIKYDVSELRHHKGVSNIPIIDMVLNELLYVASKEKILDKADYQLGHYLKNYRNMVHPAKEVREKENVTHENVSTMWSVLVRLIATLFPD